MSDLAQDTSTIYRTTKFYADRIKSKIMFEHTYIHIKSHITPEIFDQINVFWFP